MSDIVKASGKKDTGPKGQGKQKVEQYSETSDAFVNLIHKKLRNKNKKIEKIEITEQKIKNKEVEVNQEQKDMVASKAGILAEMKELEGIIAMYKEAFPDNPALTGAGQKKAKKPAPKEEKKEEAVQQPAEPQVNVEKIVRDAFLLVSDLMFLHQINANQKLDITTPKVKEALEILKCAATKQGSWGTQR